MNAEMDISKNQWRSTGRMTPKMFSPICLSKPKSLGFSKKKLSLGVRSPSSGSSYSTRSKSSRRKTTKTGSKCWVVFIIAKRKTTTYVGKVCKSVCFRKIFFRRLHNWLVAATRYHYNGLTFFLKVH